MVEPKGRWDKYSYQWNRHGRVVSNLWAVFKAGLQYIYIYIYTHTWGLKLGDPHLDRSNGKWRVKATSVRVPISAKHPYVESGEGQSGSPQVVDTTPHLNHVQGSGKVIMFGGLPDSLMVTPCITDL